MRRVALIAVLGSLALSTAAIAQKAHISVARARGEIVRYLGPGTEVGRCKQFAPTLVGCDYTTFAESVGIWTESPYATFSGFARVDSQGVHLWQR